MWEMQSFDSKVSKSITIQSILPFIIENNVISYKEKIKMKSSQEIGSSYEGTSDFDGVRVAAWIVLSISIPLSEARKVAQAGGYLVCSPLGAYTQDEDDLRIQREMVVLAECICWRIAVKKESNRHLAETSDQWLSQGANACYSASSMDDALSWKVHGCLQKTCREIPPPSDREEVRGPVIHSPIRSEEGGGGTSCCSGFCGSTLNNGDMYSGRRYNSGTYDHKKLESGAHCIQIFDSWGGQLPPDMGECWSKPYIGRVEVEEDGDIGIRATKEGLGLQAAGSDSFRADLCWNGMQGSTRKEIFYTIWTHNSH
ncbi:hypothetical protein VitviT2T_002707 [Vitis vinifera]|uniref:Uroporphyrinogen decarboxylase (URO-D) domain-containing protein n=1 Tax=Vitis vinifera TaxID=29760 RepID=A0ABY9BJJ9_VITVI|nr:hypothetical protein VitviT2T_002707 [Vitis vinifera]